MLCPNKDGVGGQDARGDLLGRFRAMDLMEITKNADPIKELDIDLMLRMVGYIKVYERGAVLTVFWDWTEIEWKNPK